MHARMYSVMCHYSDSERSYSRSSCDSEIPGQENKFRVDEISVRLVAKSLICISPPLDHNQRLGANKKNSRSRGIFGVAL